MSAGEIDNAELPAPASYWDQSRRPLASLYFVMPLLLLYEGGVLLLGPQALRNGADVWLRRLLDLLGFGQYFLLPVLTVGALLAWHHVTRDSWRVRPRVLQGMLLESILLAFVLMFLANVQGRLLMQLPAPMLAWSGGLFGVIERAVVFFGAGIYEEVLFRLLLLPAVASVITLCGGSTTWSALGAVVISSFLFSLAHYVGAYGDVFSWFTFLFRFLAGSFFAVLFVYRGFGIAAGTHALYDIFVGLF